MSILGPIKRSQHWIVQSQCALASAGSFLRHKLETRDFNDIAKFLKLWTAADSNPTDVFPNLLQVPIRKDNEPKLAKIPEWTMTQHEIILQIDPSRRPSLGCICQDDYQVPMEFITLRSSDSVHIAKGLCMIACAYKYPIALGSCARLSRFVTLCPNQKVSDWDGTVWHYSLKGAFWPSDTPMLQIKNLDTKIELTNNDITVWLPFVLLALYDGAQCTARSINERLVTRWPHSRWSMPMLTACLSKLQEFKQ